MIEGNITISIQTELGSHILTFYEQLYARDDQVESNTEVREDCFTYPNQTITKAHDDELLRPLTMEKVSNAMKQLLSRKPPGVDSIPAEFYQELWDDIEFDIFNFVSEIIDQSFIAEELNVSKIALLPKNEDRFIKIFTSISLLNTLYKVLAKVYANKMKPFLHLWILPSLTWFDPNHCILDNIFLAFEAIEWALENKQDLSMLLLDFKKAYDKVD